MMQEVEPSRMRVFGELERATRPSRVAGKINKYAGRFLRLIEDDSRVEIGAVIICQHDPRRDLSGRARRVGDGAEHLAQSLRDELDSGRYEHWTRLQEYLSRVDESLDLGRLVMVQDWDEVRGLGIGAGGYTLAPYPASGGGETHHVGLYDIACEYERVERLVRAYVSAPTERS